MPKPKPMSDSRCHRADSSGPESKRSEGLVAAVQDAHSACCAASRRYRDAVDASRVLRSAMLREVYRAYKTIMSRKEGRAAFERVIADYHTTLKPEHDTLASLLVEVVTRYR